MAETGEEETSAPLPGPGDPGYEDRVRESLARRPKPTTPQVYDVAEAALWQHRHLPVGSVIEFDPMEWDGGTPEGRAAFLITGVTSQEDGIWLQVSVLGAESDETKKRLQKYFKQGRRQIHVCCPGADGTCKQDREEGWHIREFKWFPAGDYRSPFLNSYALKKVREGVSREVELPGKPRGERKAAPLADTGLSDTERRLSALRGREPRVTFAMAGEEPRSSAPAAPGNTGPRDGALRRPPARFAGQGQPLALPDQVKVETIDLTKGRSRSPSEGKKKKKKMGEALALAAVSQQKAVAKRERSRSKKKKKKRRRKKRSPSSEEDSSSAGSSSESSSLLPPLKRRSIRQPGSVLRMLEEQAFEFLTKDGIMEAEDEPMASGQRPKLVTYYQLAIRPALDPRGRDSKELALLCRALDLLREGRLDGLGDMLAARLMAVETATRQGWPVARHLEICNTEEEGSTPAHILLAAQRHGKQVEKAGGKGSWGRSQAWSSEWQADQRNKGKGASPKGKGKKGKGKGKGGKNWNQCADKPDAKNAAEPAS